MGSVMAMGKVKWFNDQKGFGFIAPDNGGGDVFLHQNALRRSNLVTVYDGARVEFELGPDKRGRNDQAIRVVVLES